MVREFGLVLALLASRSEGMFTVSGREVRIMVHRNGWQLMTRVADKTSEVRENFTYPMTAYGSLVVTDAIYLVYDVPSLDRYMAFREFLKTFIEEAESFCQLLGGRSHSA